MTDGLGTLPAAAAYWRMAIIFDAPGRDRAALETNLAAAMPALRAAAGGAGLRVGVAEHFSSDGGGDGGPDSSAWQQNDAAIEVTVDAGNAAGLPVIAAAMGKVLAGIADPVSIQGMAGPTYVMVPPRVGDCILSLSFRRDPATTGEQFRKWWFNQHAKVAIPVLGELLLAYDQVHCDDEAGAAVAAALGVPFHPYDAYDNLTWADWDAFVASTSDPAGGLAIAEDEVGRIDNGTRRHAFLKPIAG